MQDKHQKSKPDKKRIVVLVSGSGSNLQALIDACESGQIHANIVSVISNRPNVYGLERAANHNIPTLTLNHKDFASREQFDAALMMHIDRHQADLVVMAGFMRILTPEFTRHYQGRLLNIHPSLLPLYKGLNTHQRALDDGAKIHGVSVHFVSAELDGGPVIMQAQVDVQAGDDASSLAQRVLIQEHIIYPQVVEWFCDDRLVLNNGKVWLDGKHLDKPVIVTAHQQ